MTFVDPLIGRQLAGFRLERLLGHGGMASVYYGIDLQLERPVAVKVIAERFRGDPEYAERFVREARAMAAWRHANIPQIYQAGEHESISYYVMEYIEGMDLERLLKEYGRAGELPSYVDVLFIGRAIAQALDYAHSRGVIHRDVKPSNVLVSRDDRVFLTDFGLVLDLAQGTRGEVFGTPRYMSPEQARSSAAVVSQSDLYSLGIILYEMLTGSVPFDDPVPATLALKQITDPPPPPRTLNPALSPEVEAVLLKALDKSPSGRYPTGRKLMDTLERALLLESGSSRTAALGITRPVSTPGAGNGDSPPTARTRSHLHVSEIVAQELQSGPVTRSFAGSDRSAAADFPRSSAGPIPTAGAGSPPITPPRSSYLRARWTGLGCAVLILLGLAGLGLSAVLSRMPPHSTPKARQTELASAGGAIPEPAPTETPLVIDISSPTPSLKPSVTAAGTRTPTVSHSPTATLPPTQMQPAVSAARILFFKYRQQSLVVRFEGPGAFPLEDMQLFRDEKLILDGEEWDVERLNRGDCVVVWNEKEDRELPEALECNYTGKPIEVKKKEIFWLNTFEIYYFGERMGVCEPNRDYCLIEISLPAHQSD